MTKYILAGGMDTGHPEYMKQLASVIGFVYTKPRILSCWFSNESKQADEKFHEYKDYFLQFFPSGTEFMRAHEENFLEQINTSDVIYFHGGHTSLLLKAMEQYDDMKKAFAGKIVVGSSAGANYLSSFCFSPSISQVFKASGLVDVACIVHYGSKGYGDFTFRDTFWEESIKTMRASSGKKQLLLLPEGQFAVFDDADN